MKTHDDASTREKNLGTPGGLADNFIWLPIVLLAGAFHGIVSHNPMPAHVAGSERIEEFFFVPMATSPPLIVCVFVWLLWRRRRKIQLRPLRIGECLASGVLVMSGVALLTWSSLTAAPHLSVISLSLVVLGMSISMGGWLAGQSFLWPAAFLLFAIAPPSVLTNSAVYSLQVATTAYTSALLSLLHIEHQVTGDLIIQADRVFKVIEGCSGLRTIITMPMATMILIEVSYRNRLHAGILLFLSPLIGFAMNGPRVVSMILNPFSELSKVHASQGLVMLVAGILLIAALDHFLDRLGVGTANGNTKPGQKELTLAAESEMSPVEFRHCASRSSRIGLLTAIALCLILIPVVVPTWQPAKQGPYALAGFPSIHPGWKRTSADFDLEFFGSISFDERVSTRFTNATGIWVEVLVGVNHRLDPLRSILSPRTAIPDSGWQVEARSSIAARSDGRPAEQLVVNRGKNKALVVAWVEGTEATSLESARAWLALDRGPFRRSESIFVARIWTPIVDEPAGFRDAQNRLAEFTQSTEKGFANANRRRFQ